MDYYIYAIGITSDVKMVYWYIKDKFYQKALANEKLFFTPEQGRIKISCTDDKGRNTDSWVFVRMV